MNIKKGDNVMIIAGRAKGSRGLVEKTNPAKNTVVVAGVNMRKKHLKPSSKSPKGGIIEYPGALNTSNVVIICPHCTKPTRVGHTLGADNKKYRYCKKCQGSLDSK